MNQQPKMKAPSVDQLASMIKASGLKGKFLFTFAIIAIFILTKKFMKL